MRLCFFHVWQLYLLRITPEMCGSWAGFVPFFIVSALIFGPKISLPRCGEISHSRAGSELNVCWTRRLCHCAFQKVIALTSERRTWLWDECTRTPTDFTPVSELPHVAKVSRNCLLRGCSLLWAFLRLENSLINLTVDLVAIVVVTAITVRYCYRG